MPGLVHTETETTAIHPGTQDSAVGSRLAALGAEPTVIGALAAVGLAAAAEDGRVVMHGTWPDDLAGCVAAEAIAARGIEIRELSTGEPIKVATVDVLKHLRPNIRDGRVVVFVERVDEPGVCARAVRLN